MLIKNQPITELHIYDAIIKKKSINIVKILLGAFSLADHYSLDMASDLVLSDIRGA